MLIEKWCEYCGSQLKASKHVCRFERARRDEKKRYCNGQCAAKHKAHRAAMQPRNSFGWQLL